MIAAVQKIQKKGGRKSAEKSLSWTSLREEVERWAGTYSFRGEGICGRTMRQFASRMGEHEIAYGV